LLPAIIPTEADSDCFTGRLISVAQQQWQQHNLNFADVVDALE
jgi:hypothetical protein